MTQNSIPIRTETLQLFVEQLVETLPKVANDDIPVAVRASACAFKLLVDIETRNKTLAVEERDARDGQWTRLDTMAPFHPDDQQRLEDRMTAEREIVLEQGRREGRAEALLDALSEGEHN